MVYGGDLSYTPMVDFINLNLVVYHMYGMTLLRILSYWQMHYYNEREVHFPYYGEQNYVNWRTDEHNIKLTKTPPEWIGKCDIDIKRRYYKQSDYTMKNLVIICLWTM